MLRTYLLLTVAVLFETFGSTCLQASQQFTKLWPTLGAVVGFAGAFWFFVQVLKVLPLGITYALWSGLGIILTAISGRIFFAQKLDAAALAGLGLIILGIAVINLFSKTATH
ncbi:DMT family transporter [Phaeovulum vinaykumarii]|uniref:Small multidrug resistance pump n=1 Tax=Phaeovulum vinaykumarii TaxID=407234 RepID=A0A1N7JME2_9RHOB|nr:SMR family transporter [Phaeovulum vinaykumarii]SIS50431.1 small multidrug resistance pump [Phaeovulum vinaykumarii]SOB90261.1 small multidrug resistance pump [Phaeovulum vinaykumarii]